MALALGGGAGRSTASTTPQCSIPEPTGRQFCVTIADQEGVSPSGTLGTGRHQATVTAYQFYRFTIKNAGGSTLTNGTMTVRLADHVGTSDVDSTAAYVAADSASFCTLTSSNPDVVSCKLGNIAAGGQIPEFSLVYRTSTTPGVDSTTLHGTIAFKEGSNGPGGANPATFEVSETTSLEGDPEQSVAWAPPSAQVSLATSPTFDSQFSTAQYQVPSTKAAYLATLAEGAGSLCAAGYSCFGEVVTLALQTDGTFRFHLTITIALDLVPGGSVNKIVLVHLPDGATAPEVISRRCSANPPTTTEALPCLIVTKDTKAGVAIIDAYGVDNGGWVPGL